MNVTPLAFLNLAYYFVKRFVVRLFEFRRYTWGLDAFKQNYVLGEGLAPVDASELDVLHNASKCTQCGRCDEYIRAEDSLQNLYVGAKASHLPLWLGPQPDRYKALKPLAQRLRGFDIHELQRVCPEDVPFEALIRLVERKVVSAEEPSPQ